MSSKERFSAIEYGGKSLELGWQILDKELPRESLIGLINREDDLSTIRKMAELIGRKFNFPLFGKSYDLLTQLENYKIAKNRNCRLSTFMLGLMIVRHNITHDVRLSNVAFNKNTDKHSVLLASKGAFNYMAQFTAPDYSAVELRLYRETTFKEFKLDPNGIFEFEHEIGNI